MEAAPELNTLSLLLPLLVVIFIIAGGVIVLNLHFHKNLFRQKLISEEVLNNHRQVLLRSSIQTQEEERRRISADIHDELGAVLAIAKMHLINLEQKQEEISGKDTETIIRVRRLIETTITSVRRISHELMPHDLKLFGLTATLQNLMEITNSAGRIRVCMDLEHLPVELPWPVSLGLYRVCLELINNTIKHAGAENIIIVAGLHNNVLELNYDDDGLGMPETISLTGLGHKSIEARILSIGGTISYGTAKEGGFYAHIQIPFDGGRSNGHSVKPSGGLMEKMVNVR